MLVVGLVGWGPKLHYTKLTADEQYTHMSLWAMLASPLLIGCDLAQLDPFTKSLLTNDEVIAVNQDPLGVHAAAIWEKEGRVIYVKHLEDGAMAVGLFNKTLEPAKIGFTLKQLGIEGERRSCATYGGRKTSRPPTRASRHKSRPTGWCWSRSHPEIRHETT